jgi:two-component system, chemotaxis family, sensor kinase CheA
MDAARYRDLFLTEARDHLVVINQALIALEHAPAGGAGDDGWRESVDALFRSVHTVKGMSGVMGYDAVGALTHAMETRLALARSGDAPLDAADLALLFDAADALEAAVEATATLPPAASEDAPVVSMPNAAGSALDVSALVERLQGSRGISDADRAVSRERLLPPGEGLAVHVWLEPGTILPGARAQLVIARARALGAVTAVVPDEPSLMDDGFDGAFALRLTTTVPDATIGEALRAAGFVHEVRVERPLERPHERPLERPDARPDARPDTRPGARPGARPEGERPDPHGQGGPAAPAGEARGALAARAAEAGSRFDEAWGSDALKAPLQRYVRIDLRRLDHLMAVVGELMVVRGRLAQLTAGRDDRALDDAVGDVARLIAELQDGVLGARMVPVWQIFDRFPRVVRDAARTLGKDVAFVVEGREIELDRALLEQIADPLVHLLRNAVDHGIEPPAARVAVGKRPSGTLTLSAVRERNAVVIRVRDDGHGIDRARILAKAKALGVVDPEREALDDDEVLRVIARAGFSTAERVTELSGRGVGIDAVVSRVRSLGGSVELRSVEGEGTNFSLRLPVTLAVIPALLARVGDESYALPLTHVTETLQRHRGVVRAVRGRDVIVIRGQVLPLLDLRRVVGLPPRTGEGSHVVLVAVGERRAGLVVDQLMGQDEVVVKPIDAVRGAVSCFTGATIMGDGSAALILDVSSLL